MPKLAVGDTSFFFNDSAATEKATDWAPEVGVLFSFPIGQ